MNLTEEARERIRQGARNSTKVVHQKHLDKYNKNPIFCKFCNKKLSYEKRHNKFCSHSCSASFNNLGCCRTPRKIIVVDGEIIRVDRKIDYVCLNCGKSFIDKKNENRKFCSLSCSSSYKKNEKIKHWIKGEFEPNLECIRRYYLKYRKDNIKCDVCNNTTWNGNTIPIEVDHIDGNSENNDLNNLRLICPNCHAQTNTFKGKNKGKGRFKRKQRYKDDKSY